MGLKYKMRKIIISILIIVLFFSFFNLGEKQAENKNATYIPILMYHSFDEKPSLPGINTTPKLFKEHLTLLKNNGWTTITTDQLVMFLQGDIDLPENSFMITIDDGYESVYDNAFPILKELNMNATLFVITSHIESGERFHSRMSNWRQLKEMSASGYIEIGNHTHDLHWRGNGNTKGFEAMITNMTKQGKKISNTTRENIIVNDLTLAHKLITKNIGKEPKTFAYPYGSFDEVSERAVREAGYEISFSIIEDMNYPGENSERIKRYGTNSYVSAESVLKKVTLNKKK
ncbi:polysaccharide deacetylase family protein [Solibacillus sp. FSL W8-0474]|uniref:polysaccharide deacetylase family protein n=1 Tax=Solibacillus sp. FSL W8-0474 TaxID=2975336 RepID=UPI0030F5E494